MPRDLAYNLTEDQLVPEPLTLRKLEDHDLPTLRQLLGDLLRETDPRVFPTDSAALQHRVWNMALALYERLAVMDIFKEYDRVLLHRMALDTAIIWEFG